MSHVLRNCSRLLSLVSCPLFALSLRAGEPGFSFSGQLMETSNDRSVPAKIDGQSFYRAKLYLRLYDDSEGEKGLKSQALWGRVVEVNVQNGNFACELSDAVGTPITEGVVTTSLADAFKRLSGDKLSVGVTPFSDENGEITPRQTLTAAPSAVCAHDALGSVGDLAVPGELNAAGLSADEVDFRGTVVHEGTVSFATRQTVKKLVLDDARTLTVGDLAAEGSTTVTNATAATLTAGTLAATVGAVGDLRADALAFDGSVSLGRLSPPEGSAALAVDGAVDAAAIDAKNLEVGSRLSLFQWDKTFRKLEGLKGDAPSATFYNYDSSGGWWVPPDRDVFISLSFLMGTNSAVTVSIGPQTQKTDVATIALEGQNGTAWMPFQTFVAKGQRISWSGISDPDSVLVTVREFSY